MSRHLSREASPEEEEELQDLLARSPNRHYLFDILLSYFKDPPAAGGARPAGDPDLDERFLRMMESSAALPPFHHIRHAVRRKWLIAAAVAACILLVWGINRLPPSPGPHPVHNVHNEEVLARAGARTKLVLPDGTQVWLNSNSRLKYNNDFNANNREVILEGEAYFDVPKNARLPFIVHASSIDIKVLGTSFAVKSYPQDKTIEATLLRGIIEVSRKDNPSTPRIILKPNEKLVFSKSFATQNRSDDSPTGSGARGAASPDIAVNSIRQDVPDSNKVETAWLYNRLVFDGDSFRELADKMERWYNVKINLHDTVLNSYHLHGSFEKETVEEAFKELQLTRDFNFKINGNEIELYAKK
jgi:ferric-dicitrate binding protein FerR (iron transport regulator)